MTSPALDSAFTLAACGALLLTIISLWIRPAWLWRAALAVTVALGYFGGVLHGPAVVWISLLAMVVWLYRRYRPAAGDWRGLIGRGALALLIVAGTLLLGMHSLPGFVNPLIAEDLVIAPGAAGYTLYFNFDKTIAGILLLGIGSVALIATVGEWRTALHRAVPVIALNIVVAMLLSVALGYVAFQPKWTAFFWVWAVINLLLTCLSEEAFFRGFIQHELNHVLGSRRYANTIAVGASAVLFGLAHFAGGWRYILLATIAGAGYAIVYQQTRRVEMSILAHFALNATHFLLFTYPHVE